MRLGQVAAQLNISPSTLRRWTERFEPFLSSSATTTGRGIQRDYTGEDLQILKTVQSMLDRGLNLDAVEMALRGPGDNEATGERLDLMRIVPDDAVELLPPGAAAALAQMLRQLTDTQEALLNGQESQGELLALVAQDNLNLKDENTRLRKRLRQLEEEVSRLKESDWNHRLALEQRLTVIERSRSWWDRLRGR